MSRKGLFIACGGLAVLVAGVFADVLFVPGDKVASYSPRGDVQQYFYASRTFAFGELANGRLPVWNPHIFSGTPCLANFQTALFYPPNLVYLVLPIAKAISLDLAFHVLLFGLFTFAWARSRGQGAVAAFTSGVVAMFSGSLMMHVYAGHLPMLAAFAYLPLILLVVDKLMSGAGVGWAAVGILAVSLQILAGSPHAVFITFVTAGLYFMTRLPSWRRPLRSLPLLAAIAVVPLLLTAVQLLPAIHFLRLCAPHGDGSFNFSTSFSFPPENLLMLLAPGIWGGLRGAPYAGQWQVWEVSFFIGLGGLFLVLLPLFRGRFGKNWPLYVLSGVLIVLALGRYTPVYSVLFFHMPGFSTFRVPARLLIPASLMLAVLAGEGMQELLDRPLKGVLPAVVFMVLALILFSGALYVHAQASLPQRQTTLVWLMEHLTSTRLKGREVASATATVRSELVRAAWVALAFGLLLDMVKRFPRATWALSLAVAAEMVLFAFPAKSSFHLSKIPVPGIVEAEGQVCPNRIFDTPTAINRVCSSGACDVWGSDPLLQRRYAEFVAAMTGARRSICWAGTPNFLKEGPLKQPMRVLRVGGLVDKHGKVVDPPPGLEPLPVFSLVSNVKVQPKSAISLTEMKTDGFTPATQVYLEKDPLPAPDPAVTGGSATIVEQGAAYYVVDVDVPGPAILLNTDAYAPGWTATAVGESPQAAYEVMPADYAVRAIPLAAGKHRIRIEYVPPLFAEGMYISLATGLALVASGFLVVLRRQFLFRKACAYNSGEGTLGE